MSISEPRTFRALARLFFQLLLCIASLQSAAALASEARWTSTSANGLFVATFAPQSGEVKINQLQNWVLTLTQPNGVAINAARVAIDGGMRAHGHGLPTQPQVTRYLGEGQYLIEGMRLNMAGAWTLVVGIDALGRQDAARFELEIDF